jgi:hypothetical protein
VSVPDLRERWRTSVIEATTYDWAVEHEYVAGVLGRLIWGTDTSAFYPSRSSTTSRADLSPVMLRRARASAQTDSSQ